VTHPIEPVGVPRRGALWLAIALAGATLVFFLWEEHQAHLLGALPFLLLLACPLVHLLMHGRHGGHGGHAGHDGSSHRHGDQP
jgi:hypothetical protein